MEVSWFKGNEEIFPCENYEIFKDEKKHYLVVHGCTDRERGEYRMKVKGQFSKAMLDVIPEETEEPAPKKKSGWKWPFGKKAPPKPPPKKLLSARMSFMPAIKEETEEFKVEEIDLDQTGFDTITSMEEIGEEDTKSSDTPSEYQTAKTELMASLEPEAVLEMPTTHVETRKTTMITTAFETVQEDQGESEFETITLSESSTTDLDTAKQLMVSIHSGEVPQTIVVEVPEPLNEDQLGQLQATIANKGRDIPQGERRRSREMVAGLGLEIPLQETPTTDLSLTLAGSTDDTLEEFPSVGFDNQPEEHVQVGRDPRRKSREMVAGLGLSLPPESLGEPGDETIEPETVTSISEVTQSSLIQEVIPSELIPQASSTEMILSQKGDEQDVSLLQLDTAKATAGNSSVYRMKYRIMA